jgi:hypothetical protein
LLDFGILATKLSNDFALSKLYLFSKYMNHFQFYFFINVQ